MTGNVRIRRLGVSLAGVLAIGLLMFDALAPPAASARSARLLATARASVMYVDIDGNDGGDGSTWPLAYNIFRTHWTSPLAAMRSLWRAARITRTTALVVALTSGPKHFV